MSPSSYDLWKGQSPEDERDELKRRCRDPRRPFEDRADEEYQKHKDGDDADSDPR